MIGSHRENLPNVWKYLMDMQEWSRDSPGCLGVVGVPPDVQGAVGRPSRMFGSGRESIPDVREWWESLPDFLEMSGEPPG